MAGKNSCDNRLIASGGIDDRSTPRQVTLGWIRLIHTSTGVHISALPAKVWGKAVNTELHDLPDMVRRIARLHHWMQVSACDVRETCR
jgi:hypothetical protein